MEDRVEIPESFWERLVADKRKLALVVGGVLLVAGLVAALFVVAARDGMAETPSVRDDGGAKPPGVITTATPEAPEPDGGEDTTSTDPAEDPAKDSGGGSDDDQSPPQRAAFVAYRSANAIWVAGEDGSKPRKVVSARDGAFALSPDGATIAWVDPDERALFLTDVASGKTADAGPALDAGLCWAPDSSYVAYSARVSGPGEVRRVARSGGAPVRIGTGHSPRISPDGRAVAWIADQPYGQAGAVVVQPLSSGRASRSPDVIATEVAFAGDGIVAVARDSAGVSRLVTERLNDGLAFAASARLQELPVSTAGDKPTVIAHLCSDPGGRYVAYAESGDDGYSRTSVYDTAKGASIALSVRRDTYPLCWNAAGTRVLFIEGNSFQGESTALLDATPDGLGRRVIIEGASL